jgi:hypothetical protein
MLYELRTYVASVGKTAQLHSHLAAASRFMARHGLSALGFWTEEIGAFNQVDYLLAYESIAERDAHFAAVMADPEWRAHVDEETRRHGLVVASNHGMLLKPWPGHTPKVVGKVHELRVYDAMPGQRARLQERISTEITAVFARHGVHNVGFWTDVLANNRLVYMLGYASLAGREQCWNAILADPYWNETRDKWDGAGPLLHSAWNRILRPTSYSPAAQP